LLPLVLQLTNAESVSAAVLLCCVMLRLLATYRVCVRGVPIF
jgi:hypothetical protein